MILNQHFCDMLSTLNEKIIYQRCINFVNKTFINRSIQISKWPLRVLTNGVFYLHLNQNNLRNLNVFAMDDLGKYSYLLKPCCNYIFQFSILSISTKVMEGNVYYL